MTLILSDRGGGKSEYLIQQFKTLLTNGIHSDKICLVARNREQAYRIRSRFLAQLPHPLSTLHITHFRKIVIQVLKDHWSLLWKSPPHFIGLTETFLLLETFSRQFPPLFEKAKWDRKLLRKLFSRHQLRAENALSWSELELKSTLVNEGITAENANHFLKAYTQWLEKKERPILDFALSLDAFKKLMDKPLFWQTYSQQFSHWLIDDIEEAAPLEQDFFKKLEPHAMMYYTGNPFGGLREYLGANPSYLNELKSRPELSLIELPHSCPEFVKTTYQILLGTEEYTGRSKVKVSQDFAHMLEAIYTQLTFLKNKHTLPQEIVLISWAVDEQLIIQIQTMLETLNWTLDVFRGAQVLQRDPVINTLISLIRLILWNDLKDITSIPRLSGFEMSQIYTICTQLDPFELARIRSLFQNDLSLWGEYLKDNIDTNSDLMRLNQVVNTARESYRKNEGFKTIYELASYIWNHLLFKSSRCQEHVNFRLLQGVFDMIKNYSELQTHFPKIRMDIAFIYQMMIGDIAQNSTLPIDLEKPSVKLVTLHKLCELKIESNYQLWLDLKSAQWFRSYQDPLINPYILSRSWPEEKSWTLNIDEQKTYEVLARSFRAGLQLCKKESYFYASQHDVKGQIQRSELLSKSLLETT